MQVCFIRWAIFGISSEIATPGTAVGIDRNGPPVAAPGFGSHVSSWLAPPASQSRITCFSCFFSSPARTGSVRTSSAVMSAASAAAAEAAIVPRNRRRSNACSGEPQKLSRRLLGHRRRPLNN